MQGKIGLYVTRFPRPFSIRRGLFRFYESTSPEPPGHIVPGALAVWICLYQLYCNPDINGFGVIQACCYDTINTCPGIFHRVVFVHAACG